MSTCMLGHAHSLLELIDHARIEFTCCSSAAHLDSASSSSGLLSLSLSLLLLHLCVSG